VRDEARLLGLLKDEHILEVIELVRVEDRDAVVMEFVNGVDLSVLIEGGDRPPPRALAELGAAVAGGLDRAHRAHHPETNEPLNVIHRDVKPANVMVTERGNIKLLDFGVARAEFAARESQTGQFVLGTLNYMAPEYVITGNVDRAADAYGLGITLWEAAVGEVFGQPKLREEQHQRRLDERLARLDPSYGLLAPVIGEMLSWRPNQRPDAGTLERRLLTIADTERGPGLRDWASRAVKAALDARPANPKDEVGLLGRTIRLQVSRTITNEDDPPTQWAPSSVTTRVNEVPSKPSPPRKPKVRRGETIWGMILKGTILGTALAILILIFFGALFYGRVLLP
jgi:serine/threonine protein kinase